VGLALPAVEEACCDMLTVVVGVGVVLVLNAAVDDAPLPLSVKDALPEGDIETLSSVALRSVDKDTDHDDDSLCEADTSSVLDMLELLDTDAVQLTVGVTDNERLCSVDTLGLLQLSLIDGELVPSNVGDPPVAVPLLVNEAPKLKLPVALPTVRDAVLDTLPLDVQLIVILALLPRGEALVDNVELGLEELDLVALILVLMSSVGVVVNVVVSL